MWSKGISSEKEAERCSRHPFRGGKWICLNWIVQTCRHPPRLEWIERFLTRHVQLNTHAFIKPLTLKTSANESNPSPWLFQLIFRQLQYCYYYYCACCAPASTRDIRVWKCFSLSPNRLLCSSYFIISVLEYGARENERYSSSLLMFSFATRRASFHSFRSLSRSVVHKRNTDTISNHSLSSFWMQNDRFQTRFRAGYRPRKEARWRRAGVS